MPFRRHITVNRRPTPQGGATDGHDGSQADGERGTP
jgi:hypothetical protein